MSSRLFRPRGSRSVPAARKAVLDFAALSCTLYFAGPVAVPSAAIERLIIKFDLCVCFDYCSVLPCEALRPWGVQYVNRPVLVADSSSVYMCVLCIVHTVYVCCDSWGQPLPAPLPWYLPTEQGPNCERARGVLENEASNDCWQALWKCLATNVIMLISDCDKINTLSDRIFILSLLANKTDLSCISS